MTFKFCEHEDEKSTDRHNIIKKMYVVPAQGIIIRSGLNLTSQKICSLGQDSEVTVVEIINNRVRLIHPVKGWASIKSTKRKYQMLKDVVIIMQFI